MISTVMHIVCQILPEHSCFSLLELKLKGVARLAYHLESQNLNLNQVKNSINNELTRRTISYSLQYIKHYNKLCFSILLLSIKYKTERAGNSKLYSFILLFSKIKKKMVVQWNLWTAKGHS